MRQLAHKLTYPVFLIDDLSELLSWIKEQPFSGIRILADENTAQFCVPKFHRKFADNEQFKIISGEHNKTLEACVPVWTWLGDTLTSRNHCLLNVGGGVVGDLGGFVAATFKRGVPFIQIPTTLLAMVDASVGGKVGIDFRHYKNQIGAFAHPKSVFIFPGFLETLPIRELRAGLAEIIKHHLIADKDAFFNLIETPEEKINIIQLIEHSIETKAFIVLQDEQEQSIRKVLNLGHTVGHALESYFLAHHPEQSLLHGEAVAVGIIAEAYLAYVMKLISPTELDNIVSLILRYFVIPVWQSFEDEDIIQLMYHDKKNKSHTILFVLLDGLGKARIDIPVEKWLIMESLRFAQSLRESEQ